MRLSVIAGVAGLATQAVVQLGAIRALDAILGKEAVARFGLALTLIAVSRLFELGIPASALRAIAMGTSADRHNRTLSGHQVLSSSERAYIRISPVALPAMLALVLWLVGSEGSTERLGERAVLTASVFTFIAVQWSIPLYESVLAATGRIPIAQFVGLACRLLSYTAALLVLNAGHSESTFYFLLSVGACAHAVTLRQLAKRATSTGITPSESYVATWSPLAGFSTSVTAITLLSTALSNVDKLMVARALTLAEYSGYAMAALAAGSLQVLAMPILNAGVPSLTESLNSPEVHARVIRSLNRANATLVTAAASLLAVFAPLILHAWIGRAPDAETTMTMRLFLAGSLLNTFANVPHALQLAHSKLEIGIRTHLILLAMYLPLAFALARHLGPPGAALAWLAMNVVYVSVSLPWTFWRTRQEALLAPLCADIARASIIPVLLVAVHAYFGLTPTRPSATAALQLALTGTIMLALIIGLSQELRTTVRRWFSFDERATTVQ